jgi:cytochrome P450
VRGNHEGENIIQGTPSRKKPATHRLPPRTPGLPLVGNLLQARQDPLAFLLRLSTRPDPVTGFRIGPFAGYLIRDPVDVAHVLQVNHKNYSKDNLDYRSLKPVLGEGLVTSDGDLWRRQRRKIQPAFHAERVEQFGGMITAYTREMLTTWRAAGDEGRTVDLWTEMTDLTLRIISEALFGVAIRGEVDRIRTPFDALNMAVSRRLRTPYPFPLWIPTPRNRRFSRSLGELDAAVEDIIRARLGRGAGGHDLLGHLLWGSSGKHNPAMPPRQLRDEVMTLLLAGHETTATALTWALYLLSKHPRAMARAQSELDRADMGPSFTVEHLASLGYTRQVIKETLRLYPPIWALSRTSRLADRIGGYEIPPGTNLIISPYVTHRLRDLWDDPERFDPDRFSVVRSKARPRFAFFPFGGGPRLCIGRDLAMMEAQLVLATILREFRLVLTDAAAVRPQPLITLRPTPSPKAIPIPRGPGAWDWREANAPV